MRFLIFIFLINSILYAEEPWSVSELNPVISTTYNLPKNTIKDFSLKNYLLINFINFYQHHISPLGSGHCRYYITCSRFGKMCIQRYGPIRGVFMTIDRVMRCNQFQTESKDDPPFAWW